MVYIHRHSSILRLELFGVGFTLHGEYWSNSPHWVLRYLLLQPQWTGYQQPWRTWELNCVYGYIPSILCSNARTPVAQLIRASDRHSGMYFFTNLTVQVKVATCVVCEVKCVATHIQNQVAGSYLLVQFYTFEVKKWWQWLQLIFEWYDSGSWQKL